MNKFEKVSTDHHQMSLAGEGEVLRSDVRAGTGFPLFGLIKFHDISMIFPGF